MLTKFYIAALLVDEELADQVWEAWDAGLIPNDLAAITWLLMSGSECGADGRSTIRYYLRYE